MMASNVLSRFLPPNGSPSVYETLRQNDADSNASDIEERAGLAFEDDQRDQFSDRELEEALADAGRDGIRSPSPSPSEPFLNRQSPQRSAGKNSSKSGSRRRKHSHPRWMRHDPDDGDDDVPPSLLVEGHQDDDEIKSRLPPPPRSHRYPGREHSPATGPSIRGDRTRWKTTREQLPIHNDRRGRRPGVIWSLGLPNLATVDPKEKAMWLWANVENLDNFVKDVYTYFLGNGIWSILLNRVLSLLYALTHFYTHSHLVTHTNRYSKRFAGHSGLLWDSVLSLPTALIGAISVGVEKWTTYSFSNARRRCLCLLPFYSGC
jgi:autophagy-related protein 9